MSETNQEAPTTNPIFGNAKHNWGWLLALGILFLVLGIIGLGMSFALTMASMIFFGILLIIGGVGQLINIFKCANWKGMVWHVLIGILYLGAGVTCIKHPALASTLMTALLACILLAVGLSRSIMALSLKGAPAWGWVLVSGIVTFLLGLMILLHWPISGLWFIGMIIAIELIINGWAYIFIALAARKS